MAGRLEGKVAIITGGTSGIGHASVRLFAKEGASVVVAARRSLEGEMVAEEAGDSVAFCRTDVSSEADVVRLMQFTIERFGRIDCVFNNAGNPGRVCGIAETTVDDLDGILSVHLRGVLLGMKHAAPIMIRQGSGSIINTASLAGSRSGFSAHTYSAAKAAVIHLTRCVAVELGEANIRVNSISPGPTMTAIFGKETGHSIEESEGTVANLERMFAGLQPVPKAGRPEDIAQAALFLASDGSAFLSGQDLIVDGASVGGWHWSALMQQWDAVRTLTTNQPVSE